jgi:uroporphyrinogen-III synthase
MRLVLTRPEREARVWAQALAGLGHEVLGLPLIAVGPAPDPVALDQFRAQAATCRALMFVSANAVRGFFATLPGTPGAATLLGEQGRAWVTGPGSAAALREVGVPEGRIDLPPPAAGQFDSEALWAVVHAQVLPGDRVLIVRGADGEGQPSGRPWLAEQLQAAGALVEEVAAYARQAPDWTPAQRAQAQGAAHDGHVWLLSSSESLGQLARLLPGQDWSAASAVATHERIAQAAREQGFGRVAVCAPSVEAVNACLQSMR